MKGVKNLKPRENISLRFWINMIFSTSQELSFYVWCYLFWNILIFRCKSFIKYSSPLNNFSLEIKSINTFMHNVEKWPHITLRKTCPYLELFWSVFPSTWTDKGEILSISPYSVQTRENMDQKNSEYGHFSSSVKTARFSTLWMKWLQLKNVFFTDHRDQRSTDIDPKIGRPHFQNA